MPPRSPTLLLRPSLVNLANPFRAKHIRPGRRTFLSSLFNNASSASSSPLSIHVSRTLPHPRRALYSVIADVDAYDQFLPYCQRSCVTAWSNAASDAQDTEAENGVRSPTEGQLTIGFGPVTQSYTSKIKCIPNVSVEALSGDEAASSTGKDVKSGPIRSLFTKWTLADVDSRSGAGAKEWTKVDMDIRLRLADPMMQATIAMVADETATKMIDAFVKRADEVCGRRT